MVWKADLGPWEVAWVDAHGEVWVPRGEGRVVSRQRGDAGYLEWDM